MAYATVTRLHTDETLFASASVQLGEPQTHYLRNVLRLGPGARVALFNGRDGEWWGEVESLGRSSGIVDADGAAPRAARRSPICGWCSRR